MKNIVAYCRTASELENNASIKRQAELIRRYARNRQIKISKIYMDPAKSGVTLNRPALKKLLAECREGGIRTVIVRDPDRLARDWERLKRVMQQFHTSGVRVEFSTEHGRVNYQFYKLLWGSGDPITAHI